MITSQGLFTIFLPFSIIVLCSLICLVQVCALIAYIANNMDPDQTAPLVKYFYWPFQGGTSFVDH